MTFTKKVLKFVLWLSFAGACSVLLLASGIYLYLSPKLPEVESLRQIKLQTPLRIFSSDNQLIGEFGEKRRNPIAIEDTPQLFIDAILAAEDDRFYSHSGVDIKGLLRAASQLVQSGQIQTGGSTITMQVARNFFLTRRQTFSRKFNEILLALQIEKEISKEDILELYVNKIYLGNRAYGVEAAAQVYYGKPIRELNLAQLAMIAGLPKAPSTFNPIVNPSRALIRRDWILGRMLTLGYIGDAEYRSALAEPVTASYHGSRLQLYAPYAAEMARREAVAILGSSAYTDGYNVYTTVDSKLQSVGQQAVVDGLMTYDKRHGYRGPEGNLLGESPEDENLASTPKEPAPDSATISPEPPIEEWQQTLKSFKSIAGLKAAAITHVEEKTVEFILDDGTRGRLEWDDGLSDARPYISESRRGTPPESAPDFLKLGDVIRVSNHEDGWKLSQIPDAQAALISLDPKDGAIRTIVGGLDFSQSHFNRALQAERQPGSNFKPFVYTAALENGLTPATIINDAPIVLNDASLEGTWRPENASGRFFGPTRLRQALYLSRNLVSIRVLRRIGIATAIEGMHRFGFDESKLPRDLSLALGSATLTPIQVATGYAVFANGGYQVKPYILTRIEDVRGENIYQAKPATVCESCEKSDAEENTQQPDNSQADMDISDLEAALMEELSTSDPAPEEEPLPEAPRVISPEIAYLVDDMLRDVIRRGTGRKARVLERDDLAGKTGTTNGPTDAWFSGYNPNLVTTTWLGFDQNSPLGRREYGGTSALPIWIDFMRVALDGVAEKPRVLPDGLASVRIDPATGKRANASNPDAIFELFLVDTIPPFEDSDEPVDLQGDDDSSGSDEEPITEELF